MPKERDYDKELVEKGIMVYDSKDKCYYIADGYTTDDVYDYINPNPKPKKIPKKIKVKVLNDKKFDADRLARSAAKIIGVFEQTVKDRVRLGELLIKYENGDCTEDDKKELTSLYNRSRKSHAKLLKERKIKVRDKKTIKGSER